jgi:site-specific DNA-methyltransferase (adenine-specific)
MVGGNYERTPKGEPITPESQEWDGWGTALKPAFEPIVVGRKPFAKGSTVAANVLLHGVGGLNIDGSRIGTDKPVMSRPKKPDTPKIKSDRTPTVYASEWNEYQEGTGRSYAPEGQGRWPANVILDEYSAGLLDEQSGHTRDGVAMKGNSAGNNIFSENSKPTAPNHGYGGQGGASRFFYCAKASKRDRNEGLDGLEAIPAGAMAGNLVDGQRKGGDGSDIKTPTRQNFHPTVKPTTLMRYLIKLVTPAGGTVLDPFTGSGSTGKAALLDGYDFVGVELTEEYLPIIEGRLRWANEQEGETDGTLF